MTDGPERARLRTYLTGAKDEASDLAGENWRQCGSILADTAEALRRGARQIRDGEGEGQDGGLSGMMADALLAAFEASSSSMEEKGTRLVAGGAALKDTARVMRNAKTAEAGMADLQQPPAYTAPTPMPGLPPTPEEIQAEATKRQAANQEMAAYNAARAQQEAAAAEWTQKLDAVFLESIPPMKAIHGQPDPTEPPPSVPSSPTGPSLPVTPSTPGTPDPTAPGRPDRGETGVRTDGVVRGEPVWEEDPERPEKPERPERPEKPVDPVDPIDPQPPRDPITTPTHPTHPNDVSGPTSTVSGSSQSGVSYNPTAAQAPGSVTAGGATGGVNAAALGAAGAAGGASGMAGGIRAGSAPAPTGSSPARPIGATGRSASAGALSRPAGAAGSAASRAGAAGSPAARGASAGSSAAARGAGSASARGAGAAGARGAGSAGGRAAGSAGGRGAAQGSGSGGRGSSGGRGAGAGSASGRGGRKGDRDRATDRDSLVYEQDWLGDDDVAPGVLD
jgi:hypothetical protein